jgi:hypothetical protein
MENRYGVNTITIVEERFLLAGGNAAHLVREAVSTESGRPAVPPWRFDRVEEWQSHYDSDQLQAPRWSERTLCGRDWQEMEPGDGPGLVPWSRPVHAPSCLNCLRIASRQLESRPPDERISLVAALAMHEVLEFGESRVEGVPGDQTEALRAALRKELRRMNLRGRTYHLGSTVHVMSQDAWDALPKDRKDDLRQGLIQALTYLSDDRDSPSQTGINWDTWRVP